MPDEHAKPNTPEEWKEHWKKDSEGKPPIYKRWWFWVVAILFLLVVLSDPDTDMGQTSNEASTAGTSSSFSEDEATETKPIGLGVPLETRYFRVTVHGMEVTPQVDTGNEFTREEAPTGQRFVVLDVTAENIDDESRLFTDGELVIDAQVEGERRELRYDNPQFIMGYTSFLDQIGPFQSLRTHIVYVVPEKVMQKVYSVRYRPGRSSRGDFIHLHP